MLSGSPDKYTPPTARIQLWNTGRLEIQTNFVSPSAGVALNVTF